MNHTFEPPPPPRKRSNLWRRVNRASRRFIDIPPCHDEGMPFEKGRAIRLSLPRRFICDLLHYAKRIPTVPIQRRMHLADVVAVRGSWTKRVSWCAIFMKAFAIVASRRPEFRRTFMSFPWAYLYEHPANIASIGVEREFDGEPAVFFAQVLQPELFSLAAIDQELRHFQESPIEKVSNFSRALRVSRMPFLVRRLLWWSALNFSGLYRTWYFGTFGISVTANLGAASLHQLSPVTTAVNYGVFEPNGSIDVRLTYDHRVMDGATAARALAAIEEALHVEILAELLAEAS
jgi:2-oxoacid dehydrogenase/acyltransferase catalytic subunit